MGPAGIPVLVRYGVTTRFLKMNHEICPPATLRERTAQYQRLMALRQQGTEVGGFAQTSFWTSMVGLDYNESVLKDFLNVCLDDPLPQWEMEGLRILDFCGFVRYLHHRSQWATPDHSEPVRRDFPTSPGPLTPTEKRRLRRKRTTNSTMSAPEPAPLRELTESTPEPAPFQELTESTPEPGPLREPTQPAPFREPMQPTPALPAPPWHPALPAPPWPPALPAPPWPPALPAPPWPPALLDPPWYSYRPPSPGPLPLHGHGPPSLPPFQLPPELLDFCFGETSGSRSLKGGSCDRALSCFLSPPKVAITILPDSFTLTPHTCAPTHTHTQLLPILMAYLNPTLPPLRLSVLLVVSVLFLDRVCLLVY